MESDTFFPLGHFPLQGNTYPPGRQGFEDRDSGRGCPSVQTYQPHITGFGGITPICLHTLSRKFGHHVLYC